MTGPPMDLKRLGFAGDRRAKRLDEADVLLDEAVRHLIDVENAGGKVNVLLASKLLRVARTTLLRRMDQHR